ncbi:MAG TPA: MdtA/MuxA family multidrug efflux RND transporter periplasmic adaptor subunit, partial [Ideonella sp.]|nr:MdtA/MuxA family multidrug efflux RND transporter periplasmic adaptor subunit [Ideonella sp.]
SAPAPRVPGGRRFGGVNRVQPVSVVAVRRMDIRVTAQAIGNIAAANTAVVRSRVDAELEALHFKEGQPVRAGPLLAELDARPFRIALEQAQGQLARDQAQLANARVDLQRFQELLAKDAIAGQQVDTQSAQVRQLEGTVQSDRAAVDNAKLQLSYTRVTAPISGVASLKQADLGNIVHASDANGLLSIAQVQPVAVVFAVPEAQLPTIARRMKSGDALPVEAWDRDEKSRLAEGRVASVDNAIDPATGTIKLKALFANEDSRLFPNQFVNVRLQLDTIAHTLAVPGAAVQRGSAGAFVYAVNDDRSVTVRRVQPGAEDGGWVAVQGELREGENVVTDGADRLRDGAMVEVIQSPASTASDVMASAPAASRARRSSALAASVAAAGASSAERPAWFDRLPPEVQRQMAQMSPDERRAWMRQRQHERAARSREGTNAN